MTDRDLVSPPDGLEISDGIASGRCARCRQNTTFAIDPYEREYRSDCCWASVANPPGAE